MKKGEGCETSSMVATGLECRRWNQAISSRSHVFVYAKRKTRGPELVRPATGPWLFTHRQHVFNCQLPLFLLSCFPFL